ncbi:aminopeptidase [Candidatus Bathyarchaeota archaeon]|nr:aminopeptidase [Candidatus Bathyarchaeota archaeon]
MKRFDASKGAKILVENCLNVKPKENVLIVTDTNMLEIAELLASVVSEREAIVTITIMAPLPVPGMEPPVPVAAAMKAADVIMMLTTHTMTPSQARQEAQKAGARILSLGSYTTDVLLSEALMVDFITLKPVVGEVADRLTRAEKARITSEMGTDLELSLGERKAHALTNVCHEKGTLGSPPDVEAYIAPVEDTAEGILYLDGSICLPEFGLLKDPIKLTFRKGKIIKIEGGEEARRFKEKLESLDDPEMYRLAELGIGLNPKAKLLGNPLIDEGALGTAHIALGLNYTYGGIIKEAKTHIDCIFRRPTIELDGKPILKRGELIARS